MSSPPCAAEDRTTLLATSVTSLLSTLKQTQTYDYLRAAANPDLAKYLHTCSKKETTPGLPHVETIQFADDVLKINRKQKRQERVLIITDRALYNFAPGAFKAAKRRILLRDLRGLILSRSSDEVVFQVADSYDYRYVVRRRREVLEMLSRAYERVTALESSSHLPRTLLVAFSEEAELKDMVITKDALRELQLVAATNALQMRATPIEAVGDEERATMREEDEDSTSSERSVITAEGGGLDLPTPISSPVNGAAPPSPASAASAISACPASPAITARQSPQPSPKLGPKTKTTDSSVNHGASSLLGAQLAAAKAAAAANQSGGGASNTTQTIVTPASPARKHGRHVSSASSAVASHLGGPTTSSASLAVAEGRAARSASATIPPVDESSSGVGFASSSAGGGGLHAFRDPASRLEGWLTKQKGQSKRWDRKYFVLTHASLQYYAPRIKGNVMVRATVTTTRVSSYGGFGNDAAATAADGEEAVSAPVPASTTPTVGAQPRVLLRVESGTHLRGKDALILAFASDADADLWSAALKHRNTPGLATHEFEHLEGWLMRKEKEKWIRRYVVLTGDRLWFFDLVLKGSVEFSSGVSAHTASQIQATEEVLGTNFPGRHALTRFAYRWNVSDAVRIFHLAADSEEDMDMWIAAVDRANREHARRGTTAATEEDDETPPPPPSTLPAEFVESVDQPAPEGRVTLVFTDVQASTLLWERAPDAMDAALEQHDRLLREGLKRYGGYEVKTEGDAFMVAFQRARDALLWCLDAQLALVDAEWSEELGVIPAARREVATTADGVEHTVFAGLRVRMGVHTGLATGRRNPVTGRMDYFGSVVNRAARVSDTAHGGQVVCTAESLEDIQGPDVEADPRLREARFVPLVEDLGAHELKGINEPVRIFQVMPTALRRRALPPLRTATNERRAKERTDATTEQTTERDQTAAAAAAAASTSASDTPNDREQ